MACEHRFTQTVNTLHADVTRGESFDENGICEQPDFAQ